MGTFNFMINSDSEIICYDITLNGITPPYESGAKTATHIHQAVAGENGPPRLAFPNPAGFSADTHTANFVPGAVRGQLTLLPAGGADTGVATAPVEEAGAALFLALGAVGAIAVGAVMVVRSRTRTA